MRRSSAVSVNGWLAGEVGCVGGFGKSVYSLVLVLSRSELSRLIAPGELTNQTTQFSTKIVV